MKILFPALRVRDLDASVAFYTSLGLEAVGRVSGHGPMRMAMLAWPWDDDVSLELVEGTAGRLEGPRGLDHLAIQVEDLDVTRRDLVAAGLDVGDVENPGGPDGPRTVRVVDPDGNHLELVQWPAGHPVSMTRGDFDPVTPRRTHSRDATSANEIRR